MGTSYELLRGTQRLIASELQRIELSAVEDDVAARWRRGDLAWKLQPHQRVVYDAYRAWEAARPWERTDADVAGALLRIFVLDIGRRWGKTYLVLLIKLEDALRQPGSRHTFATAFAKDIADIIIPLCDDICEDAPDDCRPVFRQTKQGESMGYYLPNKSSIKLVGVDLHPRALRGRGSDGMAFTEAGFVSNLRNTVVRICYPQFQRRPHATMILESNAPEAIDHDFDTVFAPDAKLRNAYHFGTIDDNQALSEAEKAEFIRAAGGRGHPDCEREYFGVRVRDPERTVIPEYDEKRHVGRIELPKYAHAFVFQDPGMRDLFGIVWGYWHFELQKLVILRSWAKRNAGTAEVARVIQAGNAELFGDLKYWDGPVEHNNPAMHVSDVDPRLQADLNRDHDMNVRAADKSRNNYGTGEAKLYRLRNAFLDPRDLIVIDPDDPGPLRDHLRKAVWNEARTDFQRHEVYGHYDCMMALVYGWDSIQMWRNRNPNAPRIPEHVPQATVYGPRHKPVLSRGDLINQAMQGQVARINQRKASKCPICKKFRVCDVFMNGEYVCSTECHDKWVYRNRGGKPPMENAG